MNNSILEKFTAERSLIYVAIGAIVLVTVIVIYLFVYYGGKSLELTSPLGAEEWEIGQTYEITWKARGIDRVGIALYKGSEVQWIAENISAAAEKYDWHIYAGQGYGSGFWIAVFEYPWAEGNSIDYSNGAIAITYPELSSCDTMSTEQEWPFLASDSPGLRRVFLTKGDYKGNLDGLVGADKICQQEAEELGFKGEWMAFLGGDDDSETAIERLKKSPQGLGGILVQANASAVLIRGATCHRLLGANLDDFLAKLSDLKTVNEDKFGEEFLKNIQNVWLGRIDEKSKRNCTTISFKYIKPNRYIAENYSRTTTCQNWTQEAEYVEGYPVPKGEITPSFPNCYTPNGEPTNAVSLGGLATGTTGSGSSETFSPYMGKECSVAKKLICIER